MILRLGESWPSALFALEVSTESGIVFADLQDAVVTLRILQEGNVVAEKILPVVTVERNGQTLTAVQYTPDPSDFPSPGIYSIRLIVSFPTGETGTFLEEIVEVLP